MVRLFFLPPPNPRRSISFSKHLPEPPPNGARISEGDQLPQPTLAEVAQVLRLLMFAQEYLDRLRQVQQLHLPADPVDIALAVPQTGSHAESDSHGARVGVHW